MLPYQAMAMDYAASVGSFQRHHPSLTAAAAANMNAAVNMNMNSALTHSWFVPAEFCTPFKSSQPLLEPGILELRKEKSRDAARSRRGKENDEFYALAKMLPLPNAITGQLDKASIIRLTISYLKLREFAANGSPAWNRDAPPSPLLTAFNKKNSTLRCRSPTAIATELFEQHIGTHILQSLDGFAFALAADGRFLYISETVSIYLGLSQVEMTGSSFFDYIHQGDHAEVAEQLGLSLSCAQSTSGSVASPASPSNSDDSASMSNNGTANPDVSAVMSLSQSSAFRGFDRAFCVRMKSTLTKRGCHFKSSGYRVVLLLCRLRAVRPTEYSFSNRKNAPPLLGAVSLAIALPPPSVHEIRLETDMFVTRLHFDFKIAHCEPRVSDLIDYTADELTGMSMYALCHAEDVTKLRKCHFDLINKGQMMTHYFRLMNKKGGYVWMQTCGTVVCSSKNATAEEQNIICVNYIVSGREYENVVMDCCQLEEMRQVGFGSRRIRPDSLGSNDTEEDGSPPASNPGPAGQANAKPEPSANSDTQNRSSRESHLRSPASGVEGDSVASPTKSAAIGPNNATPVEEVGRQRKRKLSNPIHREEEASGISSEDDCAKSEAVVNGRSAKHFTRTLPENPPTVKDLENAMSKHLPVEKRTDFSADALLRQQQKVHQWVHHAVPPPSAAFLRQFIASTSRESVIRPRDYSALPTPPGSEGSYTESYKQQAQTSDSFNPAYSSVYSSMDYHDSAGAAAAMTPPSSVSPRDKVQSGASVFDGNYADRSQHYADSTLQPLPLKPQPSYVEPSSYGAGVGAEQSGFHYHSGFHLYHPCANKAASYAESLKNVSNWYPTPS